MITITVSGTYSFIVGDYCHYVDGLWLTDTVVVLPCCAFGGVDSTITPISCTGGADGSITVDPVQAGTFTYTWNTVPPADTPTVNDLAAGTYVVEIDNGANCDTTVTFTLVDPPPVEMEVTGDADICIGESTTLTAVWLGTTGTVDVMSQDALVVILGFQLEKIEFSYSYDLTISELGPSIGGAHEIALKYMLNTPRGSKNKKKEKITPCRAFYRH